MSRSSVCNRGVGGGAGCSALLLLVLLLSVCTPGWKALAGDALSRQAEDLPVQSLKTLIGSNDRLAQAKTVAETAGVDMLRRIVGKDELYAKRLGFESLSQITNMQPVALPPFPVFRIGLAPLQHYDGHPLPLLIQKGVVQFVVPITIEKQQQALSAITVRLGGDGKNGKILQWGSRNLIRQLSTLRSELMHDKQLTDVAFFLLDIPALNRVYLGYLQKPNRVMLVQVAGGPAHDSMTPLPIETVLMTLAVEADVAGDALR